MDGHGGVRCYDDLVERVDFLHYTRLNSIKQHAYLLYYKVALGYTCEPCLIVDFIVYNKWFCVKQHIPHLTERRTRQS